MTIVCLLGGQGDPNKAMEPICSGYLSCSLGNEFLSKHTEKDHYYTKVMEIVKGFKGCKGLDRF